MVRAERHIGQEMTQETRSSLLSFVSVNTFAGAVRSHWGIENRVLMSSLIWLFAEMNHEFVKVMPRRIWLSFAIFLSIF